jgi:hypothetical protein
MTENQLVIMQTLYTELQTFWYLQQSESICYSYVACVRSRVSSGSIMSDYGLDDWVIGVRSPAGAKDFSSILCVQTGSCQMGTGGPFPGGKSAAGAWRWPLTPI